MVEKWDDIFNAAKGQPSAEEKPVEPNSKPKTSRQAKPTSQPKQQTSTARAVEATPWSDLEPEAKEPTVRLNVDIPVSLNDLLAEKARKLRKPKTELVRRLLEWALNDSTE